MPRPERYTPEQWDVMNKPETQAKIRSDLYNCLKRFLDTTPEGQDLARVRILLDMVKDYFESDFDVAESESDLERLSVADAALGAVAVAKRFLPSDEQNSRLVDEVLQSPPMSDVELDRRQAFMAKNYPGKKRWYDDNPV